LRLCRSLDEIVGGMTTLRQRGSLIRTVLDARPIEKLQTVSGIVDVVAYLDARRALV
jgi:hypothetical protein